MKIKVKSMFGLAMGLAFLSIASMVMGTTYSGGNYANASTTLNLTIQKFIAITPSDSLISGIQFGGVNVSANTSAYNNTNGPSGTTLYNFSVDPSSSTAVDFYNRINQTITGVNINQQSNNQSSNPSANFWSLNKTLTTSWAIMGNTTSPFTGNYSCYNVNNTNGWCFQQYFADVGSAASVGYTEKKFEFCANGTAAIGNSGSC